MATDRTDWRKKGACKDLPPNEADKLFFLDRGGSPKRARLFCKNCPVKRMCLQYAVVYNEEGIWAGTTKEERMFLRDSFLEMFESDEIARFGDLEERAHWIPVGTPTLTPVAELVALTLPKPREALPMESCQTSALPAS